ncbi:unnamed protein product [Microthlaspi erraticum]|uniref:Uncharacterized protein n=1 Tax=Microthlaspi erraticum TaxID=1685480 RepID=A0A6D2JYX1_9BRAS|nr:unnamed protein product [Microthlaspi erraticum]
MMTPNLRSVVAQCHRLGGCSIGSHQARNFSSPAPGNGVLNSSASSRLLWWDPSGVFSCFVYGALAQAGWEMYKMIKVKRSAHRRLIDFRARSLRFRQELFKTLAQKIAMSEEKIHVFTKQIAMSEEKIQIKEEIKKEIKEQIKQEVKEHIKEEIKEQIKEQQQLLMIRDKREEKQKNMFREELCKALGG